MRKIYKLLTIAALSVFGIFSQNKITKIKADIEYKADYVIKNLALGKDVTITDLNGNVKNTLIGIQGDQVTPSNVTDGSLSVWRGNVIPTTNGKYDEGWAIVDLGKDYTITSISSHFWHDQYFTDIILQVASNSDFSDAITVYNSDVSGRKGVGKGKDKPFNDSSEKEHFYEMNYVRGRYVRVTNSCPNYAQYTVSGSMAVFTELLVYGIESGLSPIYTDVAMQSSSSPVVNLNNEMNYPMYYTTDGTFPSLTSAIVSGPISITKDTYIRASMLIDGKLTPADQFIYKKVETNYALGIIPTCPSGITLLQGNSTVESITDGSFDPFNVMRAGVDENIVSDWLYLDLGNVYPISKVVFKAWHDETFEVIIQLSKDNDFENEIYEVVNDTYKEQNNGHTFTFDEYEARYLRVYASNWRLGSVWEEIQAYNAVSENLPDMINAVSTVIGINGELEVANNTDISEIGLPTSLTVKDFNGTSYVINGTWKSDNYNKDEHGFYDVYFDFNEPNLIDFYEVIKIKVEVAKKANKDALKSYLDTCGEFKESDYVSYTWNGFIDKYNKALDEYNKNNSYQVDVDVALRDLTLAAEKLLFRGDKTEMLDIIDKFNLLDASKYTTSSYNKVSELINLSLNIINDNDAAITTVNLATSNLKDAYEALELKADMNALNEAYNQAKDITKGNYTTSSYNKLADAIKNIEDALNNNDLGNDEGLKLLNDLENAKNNLTMKNDFSALEKLVNEVSSIDISKYIPSSINYEESFKKAMSVLNDDSTSQNEIDEAFNNLKADYEKLVLIPNKTQLTMLIVEDEEDQNDYTASSYEAYIKALDEGKIILYKEDATQDEINMAIKNINDSQEALVLRGDTKELEKLIKEALALNEEDYTDISYENLLYSIRYARSVIASNEASKEDVDNAIADLNESINALSKKVAAKGCKSSIGGSLGFVFAIFALLLAKKKGVEKQ